MRVSLPESLRGSLCRALARWASLPFLERLVVLAVHGPESPRGRWPASERYKERVVLVRLRTECVRVLVERVSVFAGRASVSVERALSARLVQLVRCMERERLAERALPERVPWVGRVVLWAGRALLALCPGAKARGVLALGASAGLPSPLFSLPSS